MDLDVVFRGLTFMVIGVPALVVAAIALRVGCYFAGAEVPALGRAFGTALLSWFLTVAIALILQAFAVGFGDPHPDIALQFGVFVLALLASLFLSSVLYVPLLSLRFGQALTVWVIQIVFVAGVGLVLGCLAAAVSAVFD
jgi:hypothetical protein